MLVNQRTEESSQAQFSTGSAHSVLVNRISYLLDVHGPSEPIDTACSSSLIAIHRAVEHLRNGHGKLAIAGGVNALLNPALTLSFSQAGMLSEDGRCKTFDQRANGYVRGEGVGMVVLKSLSRAKADGDRIHALIRSTSENHGGKANTLTSPNPKAQKDLLLKAYRQAGIDPRRVSYIEAHGTGTALGDPVEVEGLKGAFHELYKERNLKLPATPHIRLGSVKANIGHLESAAGIAGVLKVVQAMKHELLPGNPHLERPNTYLQLEGTPFELQREMTAWETKDNQPKIAGISSFGFGGANAHVVLEEYPEALGMSNETLKLEGPFFVPLSAKNEARLEEVVQNLSHYLDDPLKSEQLRLPDLAYTLQVGREAMECRLALVVNDLEELHMQLATYQKGDKDDLLIGNVKKDQSDFLLEGEAGKGYIEIAMKNKESNSLAQLWVKGVEIDWNLLYKGHLPNKISLPTYPFARERYWIPAQDDEYTILPLKKGQWLHPLVHENTSDLSEQKYASVFSGKEAFLSDHQVQGEKVLPGVAYLEMAREVGERSLHQSITQLRDITWLSPVRVNGEPRSIQVSVFEEGEGLGYEVCSLPSVKESLNGEEVEEVIHSQGQLSTKAQIQPGIVDVSAIQNELTNESTGEACYALFRELGLGYGPTFQCIEILYYGKEEALSKLSLPKEEGYILLPGLLDSALQTCIGLGFGSLEKTLSLPFSAKEVNLYGEVSQSYWAYARKSSSTSSGEKVTNYDIDLLSEAGEVLLSFRKLVTLPLPEDSFKKSGASLPSCKANEPVKVSSFDSVGRYYQPVWQRKELSEEKEGLQQPATVLVIGEKTPFNESLVAALRQPGNQVFFKEELDIIPEDTTAVYLLQGLRVFDHQVGVEDQIRLQEYTVFQCIEQLLGAHLTDLALTVLTHRTQAVHSEGQIQASGSGLAGLVGSLAQEQPGWKVRLVDLDQLDADTVSTVLRVPFSKAGEAQALRCSSLLERQLVPVASDAPLTTNPTKIRSSGVYVILGGAGGLGRVTTEHLVKHYQARVYWLGRRKQDAEINEAIADISTYGPSPVYLSCDATDRLSVASAYEQIKHREKAVHGLFHSAIVLDDHALVNMDERDFRKAFDVKSLSSHYLVEGFREEPLDFLCFYSSVQSYMTAPGQSNYAAGCTYQDSYAREVEQELGIPCFTMHWGYWGEVGVVASSAYWTRMSELGIGSIGAAEGMEALEVLLSGEARTLSVLQLTEGKVATPFSWLSLSRRWMYQVERSELVPETIAAPPWQEDDEAVQALEAVCYRGILQVLVSLGLEEGTPELLPDQLGILDKYRRLFSELIRSLKEAYYLEEKEGRWLLSDGKKQDLSSFALRDAIQALVDHYPDYQAHGRLLQACLESFKEIVQGAKSATDALFPEGSMDLVSGIYKGNPQADYYNQVLCEWVRDTIAQSLSRLKEGERFTILEVGAGTGGTSALLFAVLKEYKDHLRYFYTDVSKRFLLYAEEHYKAQAPYLETQLFDIEASPESQGLALGSCDLVIGANVVHATGDIVTSLQNIKGVLKKDGLLVLNELGQTEIFTTLTFGLLDGWWRYEDEELRLEGSPGLSRGSWGRVLSRTGYQELAAYPDDGHAHAQQLILAQSDGRVVLAAENAKAPSIQAPTGPTTPSTFLSDSTVNDAAEAYVKEVVGRVLKLDASRIATHASFESLGVDSILIGTLHQAFSNDFEHLTTTTFFEHRTIQELADHLVEEDRAFFREKTDAKRLTSAHDAPSISTAESTTFGALRSRRQRRTGHLVDVAKAAKERKSVAPIAIIGMSGRYPGSRDLTGFWENLKGGKDSVTEVPKARWDVDRYYDAQRGKAGKINSRWGGFIEDVDKFDPLFFKISPREAELMDPQERLFLEIAWEVMEDGGYTPAQLSYYTTKDELKTGVYVGVMYEEYQLYGAQRQQEGQSVALGGSPSSIANRVSYVCDFNGPSMAVDTMCSSSLTAIHYACRDLNAGEADVAIAGGVNVSIHPNKYLALSQGSFLSSRGRCESFGSGGAGFVPSEGVGAVLLKPLSQAERDGDRIYGIVKGSAVNHGGKTNGYTVPNPKAQAKVIVEAMERAGVKAGEISYIEAHGTGTSLGDPIEIAGLSRAFERGDSDREGQWCSIGSLKSNIGHAESAAGIGGLTKVLLQLQHGQLVPSLHSGTLNPNIDFGKTPFRVQQVLADWET
ncbi:MAG: SDR family NAD(P)-dependent oxidoreductase, partial [Verrucomicrobiota bacterium]